MTVENLHEGAEVYWNDPDNDVCSGHYKVVNIINDDIVLLKNEYGSELEAYVGELS